MDKLLLSKATAQTIDFDDNDDEKTMFLLEKASELSNILLTADDVYIRRMRLFGDAIVDKYYYKCPDDELARANKMMQGVPLMVQHDTGGGWFGGSGQLPIGRFFYSELLDGDGNYKWIAPYYYWMKEAENAETMKANIDGGVWKEASISFWFEWLECSICQSNLMKCDHWLSETYEGQTCYGIIHNIVEIAEGSLVWKGAHPDTDTNIPLAAEYNLDFSYNKKVKAWLPKVADSKTSTSGMPFDDTMGWTPAVSGTTSDNTQQYVAGDTVTTTVSGSQMVDYIWDETENYFRYRIRDPERFDNASFRTITLKKSKPIIKCVIGRLKGEDTTTKQSLLFPKGDWSLSEAKEWVKSHKDELDAAMGEFFECSVDDWLALNDGKSICIRIDEYKGTRNFILWDMLKVSEVKLKGETWKRIAIREGSNLTETATTGGQEEEDE